MTEQERIKALFEHIKAGGSGAEFAQSHERRLEWVRVDLQSVLDRRMKTMSSDLAPRYCVSGRVRTEPRNARLWRPVLRRWDLRIEALS
jgi:hypothetical protein